MCRIFYSFFLCTCFLLLHYNEKLLFFPYFSSKNFHTNIGKSLITVIIIRIIPDDFPRNRLLLFPNYAAGYSIFSVSHDNPNPLHCKYIFSTAKPIVPCSLPNSFVIYRQKILSRKKVLQTSSRDSHIPIAVYHAACLTS